MTDFLLRPLVIIESPYAGDIPLNLTYLRRCLRDSYSRGEHPFASHGFYPFFLSDSNPTERTAGIQFGYTMWNHANKIAFYVDLGWSPGMTQAKENLTRYNAIHLTNHLPFETRTIGAN